MSLSRLRIQAIFATRASQQMHRPLGEHNHADKEGWTKQFQPWRIEACVLCDTEETAQVGWSGIVLFLSCFYGRFKIMRIGSEHFLRLVGLMIGPFVPMFVAFEAPEGLHLLHFDLQQ